MKKDKLESIILLIILACIWGTSFILMKKGLVAFPAAQVASLRIVVSAIIFLPYALIKIRTVSFKQFKFIIIFALLEIGIPPFLYTFAQTKVDSATAGILNSLVPLFTLITGWLMFKLRFKTTQTIGVMLGLVGAVLLVFFKYETNSTGFGAFTFIDIL